MRSKKDFLNLTKMNESQEKMENLLRQLDKKSNNLESFKDTISDLQQQESELEQTDTKLKEIEKQLDIPKEKQFKETMKYENISDYFIAIREALDEYDSASDSITKLEKNITK